MRTRALLLSLAVANALPAQRQDRDRTVDPFAQLAERYDQDENGEISPSEYPRGEQAFANLDRDGDGVLTPADFRNRRSRGGAPNPETMREIIAQRIVLGADGDGDATITTEEWSTFVADLSVSDDGVVDRDALRTLVPRRMPGSMLRTLAKSLDQNGDDKVQLGEIRAMFSNLDRDGDGTVRGGELGRRGTRSRRGGRDRSEPDLPVAGDPAPDFELTYAVDSERTVRLSSFRGDKPVALIFGSYT